MTDPIREAAEAAMKRADVALFRLADEGGDGGLDTQERFTVCDNGRAALATLRTILDGYAAVCAAPDPHPCDICVQHPKGYGCGKECPAMELWRTREAARDSLATLSTKAESMGGEG